MPKRYYVDLDGYIRDEFGNEIDGFGPKIPSRWIDDPMGAPRTRRPRRAAPPKPKPTAEEIKTNFSTWVKSRKHFHGIRLASVADVRKAVSVFGGTAPTALVENTRQIDDAYGGTAAGMFMLASLGRSAQSESKFLQRLLNEIEAALNAGKDFQGSWDYDGPGPFHKAGLNVNRLEDGGYVLSIYAAYVGSRPEHRLGDNLVRLHESREMPLSERPLLGMPRIDMEMRFAVAKGSNRFEIPIRAIFADIDDALSTIGVHGRAKRVSDADVVRMLVPDEPFDSAKSITVYEDDAIKVIAQIPAYRVEPNYVLRNQPDRDAEIRLVEGILSGPAHTDTRFAMYESMEIDVMVAAASNERSFSDAEKERIETVASIVYERLKNYGPEVASE